jgi:hypothetical protein
MPGLRRAAEKAQAEADCHPDAQAARHPRADLCADTPPDSDSNRHSDSYPRPTAAPTPTPGPTTKPTATPTPRPTATPAPTPTARPTPVPTPSPAPTIDPAAFYVDKNSIGGPCADTNPGNITRPWCTLKKANASLQAGDTVYVRRGTYDEVIEPSNSGTAGKKIIYKAYPGEEVLLRGKVGLLSVVSIGYGMTGSWNAKSYIVVDGFKIRHIDPSSITSGYAYGVIVYGTSSVRNEIRNCHITCQGRPVWRGSRERGISLQNTHHTSVENNTIDGWCNIGILSGKQATHSLIRNNTVVDTIHSNVDFGSSKGLMQNTILEGNFLCNSLVEDGIQFENDYDMSGIDYGSNRGVLIRNNVICNSAENNIDLKGAADIVIENNILYGASGNNNGGLEPGVGDVRYGGAHSIMHGSKTGSQNVIIRRNVLFDGPGGILAEKGYKIHHNTIWFNNRDYTGPNSSWSMTYKPAFVGVTVWSDLNNIDIKNNIFGGHRPGEIAVLPNADLDIDNNLYFNSPAAGFIDYRGTNNWTILRFSAWKTLLQGYSSVKGKDAHSIEADPLLVNAPKNLTGRHELFDFRLKSESPAVNAGAFIAKTAAAGSGTVIRVDDARNFFDGWGVTPGDLIQLQGQTQRVRIVGIDYAANTLTLDTNLSWSAGQGVTLAYNGTAPDIGAFEFGG